MCLSNTFSGAENVAGRGTALPPSLTWERSCRPGLSVDPRKAVGTLLSSLVSFNVSFCKRGWRYLSPGVIMRIK